MHQKVLQYPVKLDNKGRINAHWTMKTFPSKSTPFFGISDIRYTSLAHSKMMNAVTSHLFRRELMSEMPPGSAKDIFCMAKLTDQNLRVYKFCTFPFIS